MTDSKQNIILGVDTHKDFHHAAVITGWGEPIADQRFEATPEGYRQLFDWATGHGVVLRAGVEGTGSYGAGLTGLLLRRSVAVIDVIAPDRQLRRLRGKTDQLDAYNAARAVLDGRATTIPKTRDGSVEALRVLRTARQLLVKQRTETINQLHALLVSAPAGLRARLAGLKAKKLALVCSRLRDRAGDDLATATTTEVLRTLARHYLDQLAEAARLAKRIQAIVKDYAPELLAVYGVGPDVAATLLVVAGENVDRIGSEAAFAHLIGTAPIPASSGKTTRFRLNRGGNRQGNCAAYRIVMVRMKAHPETLAYVQKSIARRKSKRETMRLLKRYVAREIYPILIAIQQRHNIPQTIEIAA
jgi:transposase